MALCEHETDFQPFINNYSLTFYNFVFINRKINKETQEANLLFKFFIQIQKKKT